MKKIYITGVPGNGKSAVAQELNKKGIFTIDLDDISNLCGWIDNQTKKAVDDSEVINFETQSFVCSTEKLKTLLNVDRQVVVVGIAGNQNDFLSLFDSVFVLRSRPEIFLSRLGIRPENTSGPKLKERDFLTGFYQSFEQELIDRGAIPINAEKPLDEVMNELILKF